MSDIIIKVENLSKKYQIKDASGEGYGTLRDSLAHKARSVFRGEKQKALKNDMVDFWALRDVSFEVGRGEVVGIIGGNGAGKSTLLKILSRITEPTKGRITLGGRVASLLEVGTGFHSELTGRENIFLNGAILGMSKAEIERKFDEIVAFAEVEKFLDTPVKRYSSGMYVRLAFSVAAHLEPEILVVDEVLAVGDVQFQRKCLGRMGEVARGGRTVLFVSHNVPALLTLCKRGIVLDAGACVMDAGIPQAVTHYTRASRQSSGGYSTNSTRGKHSIVRVDIPSLEHGGIHVSGSRLAIEVVIRSTVSTVKGCLSIQVINQTGAPVLHLRAYDHAVFFGGEPGQVLLQCVVEDCRLNVGSYTLAVFIADPPGGELHEKLSGICEFIVQADDSPALFGWRPESCCYVPPESWTQRASE